MKRDTLTPPVTHTLFTLLLGLLVMFGFRAGVLAQSGFGFPVYEPFAYATENEQFGATSATVPTSATNWLYGNSVSSSSARIVAAAALGYPALLTEANYQYPGTDAAASNARGLRSNAAGKNRGGVFPGRTNITMYASFLLNIQSNSLTAGNRAILALSSSTSGTGPVVNGGVWVNQNGQLLISKNSSSTPAAATTYGLSTNVTYLVVMRYKVNTGSSSDDEVALWLNPTSLGNNATEPAPTLTTTVNNDVATFNSIAYMQPSGQPVPSFYLDEIRVSTNWAGVTPTNGWAGSIYTVSGGGNGCPGDLYSVNLSGSETGVDYHLYTNGVASGLSSAGSGAALNFGNFSSSGIYTVLASNTTSSAVFWMNGSASITVATLVSVTANPADYVVHTGGLAQFKVTAAGTITSYQWRKNGVNLTDGGNVSGATTATLTLVPTSGADAASSANGYDCVVTGQCASSATSTRAALTVGAAADLGWAGDGGANAWDIGTTANWTNGTTTATFYNGDRVLFDDSTANLLVNLTNQTVNPASIRVDAANNYNFAGGSIVGATTTFTKAGSGTLEITTPGAHTFGGAATLSNGLVFLRQYPTLGTGPLNLAGGNLTLNPTGSATVGLTNSVLNVQENATITYNGSGTFAAVVFAPLSGTPGKTLTITTANAGQNRFRLYGNFTNAADILLNDAGVWLTPYVADGTQVYNGLISGSGNLLNRAGGSTIVLNNTNTYTGATWITTGTFGVGRDSVSDGGILVGSPLGTGALTLTNEANGVGGNGSLLAYGGARTVANPILYAHTNEFTLILTGTNNLTLAGDVALEGQAGPLGGVSRAIQVNNTARSILAGTLNDGGLNCGVTKTGAGTLTLNGTNAAAGLTLVSAGVLDGTGLINGNVTVESGGALGAGSGGIGALRIGGNLSLGGGLFIEVNKSVAPSNDSFVVTGTINNTGTGTVTVSNLGPALALGDSFKLFSTALPNGAALTIAPAPGAGLGWTNKLAIDGTIAIVTAAVVVNPNPTNLTAAFSSTDVTLSWPASHKGWNLQVQTNARSVGLTASGWFTVPGSAATNSVTIPTSKNDPTVFYRLQYQLP